MPAGIFFRFLCDHIGKQEHCDNVRDRHQSVQQIRQIPYGIQSHDTADEHARDPEDLVHNDHLFTEQIHRAALSVIIPSEDRGECKGDQAHDQDRQSDLRDHGKCHAGQFTSVA